MGVSAGSFQARFVKFMALSLLVVFLFAFFAPSLPLLHAQDETPAAPVKSESPNLFWHIVKSAGPVFGPILLLISIALVALLVMLAMDLRLGTSIPPDFVEEFTDTVNKRRFKEAFELARGDNSYLGRVLTTGMGRLQYGIEDAREAAFNMVESIKTGKDQLLAYVATIGTLGPMIGLVGTVFGMILAFMELGKKGTKPDPAALADGISHALVITLLGIGIAVPAIFGHAFFRNRLMRISTEAANIADDLLTQMYHFSRKPGAAETKPAAVPAAPAAAAANTEPRGGAAAIKPAAK